MATFIVSLDFLLIALKPVGLAMLDARGAAAAAAELASSCSDAATAPCVAALAEMHRDDAPEPSAAELEALLDYAAALLVFSKHTIAVASAFRHGARTRRTAPDHTGVVAPCRGMSLAQ